LRNIQFREKRPSSYDESVWKTTNSDEPDDVIVNLSLAAVQNLPSDDELELEPSYSDTLS